MKLIQSISLGVMSSLAAGAVFSLVSPGGAQAAENWVRSSSGATYRDMRESDSEAETDSTERRPARRVYGPSSGRLSARPTAEGTPTVAQTSAPKAYGWQRDAQTERADRSAARRDPRATQARRLRPSPVHRAYGQFDIDRYNPRAWLASYGVNLPAAPSRHVGRSSYDGGRNSDNPTHHAPSAPGRRPPQHDVSRVGYNVPTPAMAPRQAGRRPLNSGRGPARVIRTAQAGSGSKQAEEIIPAPSSDGMMEYGHEIGPDFGGDYGPEFGPGYGHEYGPEFGPGHGPTGDGCGCFSCTAKDICGLCRPCGPIFDNVSLFAGVHGFKGPVDQGQNSNFGFQQGFQIAGAMPFGVMQNVGYQFGYQATQSQLSGDLNSDDSRNQNFITFGLFRRKPCGLQWGVVYDSLNDRDNGTHDVGQVRIHLSLLNQCGNEIGFWTALHASDDTYTDNGSTTFEEHYETIDLYAFFYRWRFENCGNARLWAGFSGDKDGLFGGDFEMPVNDRFALQASFNYLIPDEDTAPQGTINEGWNLGINMVWYFGCKARCVQGSPYQPMFNVADNGSMIVGHRQVSIDD